MTVLPIVGRELRVASRRPGTYWLRVTAGFVAIAVFGWMLLTLLRSEVPPATHGGYLFRALFGLAFVCCLFVGARLTADCLSEEKREGTLGLLFLTDLKGYDVVLGKLAATSLNSVYALLALLPVISLPVQLGGVAASELWQSALVLLNTIFFSLAVGIFVSTLSRDERKSMFATVFVVLLATFAPFILVFVLAMSFPQHVNDPSDVWPILALSPGYGLGYVLTRSSFFTGFAALPAASFWCSLLVVHLASWGLLLVASRILPWVWQTRDSNSRLEQHRARLEQWAYGRAEGRRTHRAALLEINPFLWLVSRERWKPSYVWLYLGSVAGMWFWGWFNYDNLMFDRKTLVPTVFLFQSFLKLWVVSETCQRLAEDRRIGALELLLSTPLTTREILRGQWLALKRQFAKPLAVVLVLEYLFRVLPPPGSLVLWGECAMLLGGALRSRRLRLVARATLALAIVWTAGRSGAGSPGRNLEVTALDVGQGDAIFVRLPDGLSILIDAGGLGRGSFEPSEHFGDYLWSGIGLASDFVFGFCWARRQLLNNFRQAATRRYQPSKFGWFSGLVRRKDVAPLRAPVPVRET